MDYNFIDDYDENLVIKEQDPVYPDDEEYAPRTEVREEVICRY